MATRRNVAILIFDEVEVLDFAGPFEVFSVTGRRDGSDPFNVFTVAENARPIIARNNLSVNPAYTVANCPKPDILLIPGGYGTRREMDNEKLLGWIAQTAHEVELLLSVCTGALLLGRIGLLDGLRATTHHLTIDLLKEVAPRTAVEADQRIVDNGRIVLSAGVAAGIDMSFAIVSRLCGEEAALETARYIEYPWPR